MVDVQAVRFGSFLKTLVVVHALIACVFDTMFSTSSKNDTPKLTPAPFDKERDGLVIGEGAGTVVLEEYEHAKTRGANILGELIGFATNCDATHITSPNQKTIQLCIEN